MMLRQPPREFAPQPFRLLFMSGLSDPQCCALSDGQHQLLRSLNLFTNCQVASNFPWLAEDRQQARHVPLWKASWHNSVQFLRASTPVRDQLVLQHWNAVVACTPAIVVITLSCGLQIVNHCLRYGAQPSQLHVIALGPVAWRRPSVSHTLITGGRDWISLPFFPRPDIVIPRLGHLDYVTHPSVSETINRLLCNSTLKSLAPAASFPAIPSVPQSSSNN
ncbi:MAG: hypothetical protein KDA85_00290 [Planctomycetaceae bacterium]|nr:hypothetical protein [Planctomycetaceae bacterium]